MTILGRGILGVPLSTDSLLIGVGGILDELPIGSLDEVLTVTGGGIDWAAAPVVSVNSQVGIVVLDLINIDDVDISSPSNNDVLTFNSGSGNWEALPAPGAGGGEANTAVNVGAGAGVFRDKTSTVLNFRSIVAGSSNITVTQNANDITLDVPVIGEDNTASSVGTGASVVDGKIGSDLQFKSLVAGTNVFFDITSDPQEIVINASASGNVNSASNVGAGKAVFKQLNVDDLEFRTLTVAGGLIITQLANEIDIDASNISGTVISIGITDTGGTDFNISGSPVTSTGNIDLELKDTAVTPGSFTSTNITVDSKGRITAIASGGGGGGGDMIGANNLSDVASSQTSIDNLTNQPGVTTTVDELCLRDHGANGLVWCLEEDSSNTTNLFRMLYNDVERLTVTPTGTAIIKSRNSPTEAGTGTDITVTAGAGNGAADGGIATLLGGAGALSSNGGDAIVQGGDGHTSGDGGDVFIIPGVLAGGGANGNIIIGLGAEALTWPTADGTSGQVMTTDGAGNLSFASDLVGLQNIIEDTTPQLGANLDLNTFDLEEDGNVILSFTSGGELAVNWIDIKHATTGSGPIVRVVGADTNIDLVLDTKGTGDIDASTNKIVNVVDPVADQDAATKKYVDDQITASAVDNLGDLLDVDVPTPSDNDVLTFNNGTGFWESTAPTAAGILKVVLRYNFVVAGGTITRDGSTPLPSGWAELITPVGGDTHDIGFTHSEGNAPLGITYYGSSGLGGTAPFLQREPTVSQLAVSSSAFATQFTLRVDASDLGVNTSTPGGHFFVIMAI